jgi:hypothetical protein
LDIVWYRTWKRIHTSGLVSRTSHDYVDARRSEGMGEPWKHTRRLTADFFFDTKLQHLRHIFLNFVFLETRFVSTFFPHRTHFGPASLNMRRLCERRETRTKRVNPKRSGGEIVRDSPSTDREPEKRKMKSHLSMATRAAVPVEIPLLPQEALVARHASGVRIL